MLQQGALSGRADTGHIVQNRGLDFFASQSLVIGDGKAVGFVTQAHEEMEGRGMLREENWVRAAWNKHFIAIFAVFGLGQRTQVYIEAMTQFDDVDGVEAKHASLLVGASLSAGTPPGRLWLQPSELSGGHEFSAQDISVPLRKTVRDQFKILLRF